MSKKGTKLNKESRVKISDASKRRGVKKANLELSIEGKRIYIRSMTNSSISMKVDITSVWNFFKEVIAFQDHKNKGLAEEDFILKEDI